MNQLVDMHCHILPGIDDGSRNMEQSINMIKIAYDEGIRTIILTPHYHPAKGTHNISKWEETYEKLKTKVKSENIDIDFYLGAELFYTHDASEYIENGQVISMSGSDYMLVEFRPETEFSLIKSAVYDILSAGKKPIIAHIERYDCIVGNIERVEDLIDLGAYIQVNASTVTGGMGLSIKFFIKKLLKRNLVHFIGTDAHSDGHRSPRMAECFKYIAKKCGEEYALEVMRDNALKIISNQEI